MLACLAGMFVQCVCTVVVGQGGVWTVGVGGIVCLLDYRAGGGGSIENGRPF